MDNKCKTKITKFIVGFKKLLKEHNINLNCLDISIVENIIKVYNEHILEIVKSTNPNYITNAPPKNIKPTINSTVPKNSQVHIPIYDHTEGTLAPNYSPYNDQFNYRLRDNIYRKIDVKDIKDLPFYENNPILKLNSLHNPKNKKIIRKNRNTL